MNPPVARVVIQPTKSDKKWLPTFLGAPNPGLRHGNVFQGGSQYLMNYTALRHNNQSRTVQVAVKGGAVREVDTVRSDLDTPEVVPAISAARIRQDVNHRGKASEILRVTVQPETVKQAAEERAAAARQRRAATPDPGLLDTDQPWISSRGTTV